MVHFLFNTLAFNDNRCEGTIEILVSSKNSYLSPADFLDAAITYLDEVIYPGEGVKADCVGAVLKEGLFADIVSDRLSLIDKKIEFHPGEIKKAYRVKCRNTDPLREDFVLDNNNEYMLFTWYTSA